MNETIDTNQDREPLPPPAQPPLTTHEPTTPATPPPQKNSLSVWRIFFGLAVVIAGIIWFANASGWGWFTGIDWWRLWPVVIVLAGITIIAGTTTTGKIVAFVVGIILIAGAIVAVSIWPTSERGPAADGITINVERETAATSADIALNVAAGEYTIRGGSEQLLHGTFRSKSMNYLTTSTLEGSVQNVNGEIDTTNSWLNWGWSKNTLDAALSNDLPIALSIDGGAMTFTGDLRDVQLTAFNLDSGASSIDLQFGTASARTDVTIDSGASKLRMAVPVESGVRITLDTGATSKHLPDDVQEKEKGVYESANYGTAPSNITMDIHLGASSLTIVRQ